MSSTVLSSGDDRVADGEEGWATPIARGGSGQKAPPLAFRAQALGGGKTLGFIMEFWLGRERRPLRTNGRAVDGSPALLGRPWAHCNASAA